jgi:hypothetical protein
MISTFAPLLVAGSAGIVLALGLIHLWYTFQGVKLHPRDAKLLAAMQHVSPVLTRQTTMWKCWVGFNASHSLGAMLFAAVYGYLALREGAFLFQSWYLMLVGLAMLGGYAFLGRSYWFSVPFRCIVLATVLYAAALAMTIAGA